VSWLSEGLRGEEEARVAAVLEGCPALVLREGASYPSARLPSAELLLVEDGVLLLTRLRRGASRRMILDVAGPGTVLPRPGPDDRLEVLSAAWVTALPATARADLARIPGAAAALLEGLTSELQESHESLGHFSSVRHVERVRDKLLQLARTHGRVVPGGVRLDLPLTHELLGEMVGSARETVTWAIAQLTREGFVRREGRFYRLSVSPEALAS
jgi:CRP-like cAMP-binding protein